jgi:hypothetical protein
MSYFGVSSLKQRLPSASIHLVKDMNHRKWSQHSSETVSLSYCDGWIWLMLGYAVDLEWCGNTSFLFLAAKYADMTRRYQELELRCESLENMLSSESSSTSYLRKQLKQLQLLSQDNEWQLQEQLAHTNSQLSQEKDANSDLRHRLSIYESKLIEVEMYFSSDKGALTLQLEQELAASKLRIAELEAEKDEYELLENQRKNQYESGKFLESIDERLISSKKGSLSVKGEM